MNQNRYIIEEEHSISIDEGTTGPLTIQVPNILPLDGLEINFQVHDKTNKPVMRKGDADWQRTPGELYETIQCQITRLNTHGKPGTHRWEIFAHNEDLTVNIKFGEGSFIVLPTKVKNL